MDIRINSQLCFVYYLIFFPIYRYITKEFLNVNSKMDIAQWQEWFFKCMNVIALIKTYLNIDPNKELLKDSKFEALLQKAILVK